MALERSAGWTGSKNTYWLLQKTECRSDDRDVIEHDVGMIAMAMKSEKQAQKEMLDWRET